MALLNRTERHQLQLLSRLTFANPFLPERIELEREILGSRYRPVSGGTWSRALDGDGSRNAESIRATIQVLASTIHRRMFDGVQGSADEHELYNDLILHLLFFRLSDRWYQQGNWSPPVAAEAWESFCQTAHQFYGLPDRELPSRSRLGHIFAAIYQTHRAFDNIFQTVIGRSPASAQMRAMIWQSIFTHDMRRYQRSLYGQMAQIATLITGPSGTGKELVAGAIGRSLFCPFDPQSQKFAANPDAEFRPLHLAALPATLVESELFGHTRGAFTGAARDREGWLESVGPHGAVFLDEVGEVDLALQVKLLRVLQTREFLRVGDTSPRHFQGKLIAATNRDLRTEISRGTFREDLYYRLCGDVIRTPSLKAQLAGAPEDLEHSVRFIARQLVPEETDSVTSEVLAWIGDNLPDDYDWPGNFRELEQCVRNLLVHRHYEFSVNEPPPSRDQMTPLAAKMQSLKISAEQLLSQYCTYAYWRTGNYEVAASHLQLDRRTLRARVDETLLAQLRSQSSPS